MPESSAPRRASETYRAVAELLDFVRFPVTLDLIIEFTSRHANSVPIFAGATFGNIRWKRSLGRPSSPQMSSGFVVTHEAKQHVKSPDDGTGHPLDAWWPVPAGAPIVWDGPNDDEYFHISYLTFAPASDAGIESFRTELAPAVQWTPPVEPSELLLVNPSEFTAPVTDDGSHHILPQQEVVLMRIPRGGLLTVETRP